MWGAYVQRQRGNGINQRAVATFMADKLTDTTGIEYTPAKLKDRIARALKGDVFTDETASLFIAAFEMTHQEAEELHRAVAEQYLAQRTHAVAQSSLRTVPDLPYRQLMITFVSYIDVNGFIRRFEVTETIRAEKDGLSHVTPLFEGTDLNCIVDFGGTIESLRQEETEEAYNSCNQIWEISIKLPRVLSKGEIHQYRYRCDLQETHASIEDLMVDGVYYNQSTFGPFNFPYYNLTMTLYFDGKAQGLQRKMWTSISDSIVFEAQDLPTDARIYSSSYPMVYKSAFGYTWKVNPPDSALAQENTL